MEQKRFMKDPNEILQKDPAQLAAMIKEYEAMPRTVTPPADIEGQGAADQQAQEAAVAASKKARLERYLNKIAAGRMPAFERERNINRNMGVIPTGFTILDDVLGGGLMPKLYGVGAEPGMGKTAFVLQIADQIAARGKAQVIIASLEMSAHELIARSLCRMTYERARKQFTELGKLDSCGAFLSGENAQERHGLIKSDDILMGAPLSGKQEEAFEEVKRQYEAGAASLLVIREARENIETLSPDGAAVVEKERTGTAVGLRRIVEEHIEMIEEQNADPGKATPKVLIVDYLQRIKPEDRKTDTRAAVEEAVETLKDISREYNMPVIFVSSLGRASYGEGGGLSSFKESGMIEYTADVAMIMTLSAHREIANPGSGKSPDAITKAAWYEEQMRKADRAEPKYIDISLPKARSGRKATVQFALTGAFYHLQEVKEITEYGPVQWYEAPGKTDTTDKTAFKWPGQV